MTAEGQRGQWWRLEGREAALGGVEEGGGRAHGSVVVGGKSTSEWCWGLVCTEATEQAVEGVRDRVGDVVEKAALDLCATTVSAPAVTGVEGVVAITRRRACVEGGRGVVEGRGRGRASR